MSDVIEDRDALLDAAALKLENARIVFRAHCAMNTPADPVEAAKAIIQYEQARKNFNEAQNEFHRLWGY